MRKTQPTESEVKVISNNKAIKRYCNRVGYNQAEAEMFLKGCRPASTIPFPELEKLVNSDFRGQWINSANIGKNEAEIISLWNKA